MQIFPIFARQTIQFHFNMKKLFNIIAIATVAFTMMACGNNRTQSTDSKTDNQTDETNTINTTETSEDSGKAFLENFYQGLDEVIWEEGDREYVNEHVTPAAKQFLIDQYDYECPEDDECMALWMFSYQGGGDVVGICQRTIEPVDGLTYRVTNNYYEDDGTMTYQYIVSFGLVKEGDTFKINSISPEGESYFN